MIVQARLVGVTGVSGCGKTTVSELLRTRHGFCRLHFPYVFPAQLANRLLLSRKVPSSLKLGAFGIDRTFGMLITKANAQYRNVVLDRWWFDACLNVKPGELNLLSECYKGHAHASLFSPSNFVGIYLVGPTEEFVRRKGRCRSDELRRQADMFELGYQVLEELGLPLPIRVDALQDPETIANDIAELAASSSYGSDYCFNPSQ